MWTEKTKNGKYKHVERYTDPITGKEKKVSVTTEKIPHRPESLRRGHFSQK